MIVEVSVTQGDIDTGERCSPQRCPVAKAASRATGLNASVGIRSADLFKQGEEPIEAGLPPEAVKFIKDFDSHIPVSPFTFPLDIPQEAKP
jgi:hypothetical protein